MNTKRTAAWIFAAALAALLVWAGITAALTPCLTAPERRSVAESAQATNTPDEEILFDDDSTVDFSEPALPVFDPASDPASDAGSDTASDEPSGRGVVFEFAVTPDYFAVLLQRSTDKIPLQNAAVRFGKEAIVITGDAVVADVARIADLPAALTVFLPKTLPCRMECVPVVDGGRLRVRVLRAKCDSDVISAFFGSETVLSAVEGYINGLLAEHLPQTYRMEYTSLSAGGIYVRFRIEPTD